MPFIKLKLTMKKTRQKGTLNEINEAKMLSKMRINERERPRKMRINERRGLEK